MLQLRSLTFLLIQQQLGCDTSPNAIWSNDNWLKVKGAYIVNAGTLTEGEGSVQLTTLH